MIVGVVVGGRIVNVGLNVRNVGVEVGMICRVGTDAQEPKRTGSRKQITIRFIEIFTAKTPRSRSFLILRKEKPCIVFFAPSRLIFLDPAALSHCFSNLFFEFVGFCFQIFQLSQHLLSRRFIFERIDIDLHVVACSGQ